MDCLCISQLTSYFSPTLHLRLNAGWSFHSNSPAKKSAKSAISDVEQEIIKGVLERAGRIQQVEGERIG